MRIPSAQVRTSAVQWLRRPLVAPLLRERRLAPLLAMAGVAQVVLGQLHLPLIPCPLLQTLGVPCPGCGITRSCLALIRGDWSTYLKLHAFAPVFLVTIGLFALAALLPGPARSTYLDGVERFERRTLVPRILLVMLFLYWLARLVYAPAYFTQLMSTG